MEQELFEQLVVGCTREIVAQYGVDKIMQLGGVEFLWGSIVKSCPPEALFLLPILEAREREARQMLAGILGMA
jgi:hypothetical protein